MIWIRSKVCGTSPAFGVDVPEQTNEADELALTRERSEEYDYETGVCQICMHSSQG